MNMEQNEIYGALPKFITARKLQIQINIKLDVMNFYRNDTASMYMYAFVCQQIKVYK